jgi:5-methylcytosine-specific restriction endonuclease McrA
MHSIDRTRQTGASARGAPTGGLLVKFVSDDSSHTHNGATHPSDLWSAASPWQGHPAILPPLPRTSKSAEPDALAETPGFSPDLPRRATPARPATRLTAPAPHPTNVMHANPARQGAPAARPAPARQPTRTAQPAARAQHAGADLRWPSTFDDWMIDIVRRRALRLNSGARRRGAIGSVRAVELAQILERSRDAEGRWRCALCKQTVTLNDLSFDHVVALADGGEHAAYNLVPAHRKCNEIKGSEKAQYRTQALDRWLNEWATTHHGATPRGATRHPATPPVARTHDWRFV